MTPWHYRWLCQFAYIDLPQDIQPREQTLRDISKELLERSAKGSLKCGRLSAADEEMLRLMITDGTLGELRLVDYINLNVSTGFAAYALRAEAGGIHCIFRGSEGYGCGSGSIIDWIDNFLSPFYGSVQYKDIERFIKRFDEAAAVFSGHSKGAHNALYALAKSEQVKSRAVVFNGQGFASGQLSRAEKERLGQRGINYVTRGDIVGVLLRHPERRVFVRRQEGEKAHSLSGFSFDAGGEPIPARRPLWTWAAERISSRTVKLASVQK